MPRTPSSRLRTYTAVITLLLSTAAVAGWLARPASTAERAKSSSSRGAGLPAADAKARERAASAYGKLPLSFEANHGQTDSRVNFISRAPGYNLFLTPTEAVLVLRPGRGDAARPGREDFDRAEEAGPKLLGEGQGAAKQQQADAAQSASVLRMQVVGADASRANVRGGGELPGKINYLLGDDPARWRTNIPTYAQVRYEQVYPGVDMVYYGNQQQLEYDFVVAPGASPDAITVNFDGAQSIHLDGEGNLALATPAGELRQQKPFIYQVVDGERREVSGRYVRKGGNSVGFSVPKYDRRKPLVIDPILVYSSFVNAGGDGIAITTDPSGNTYITGFVSDNNFNPTPGAYQIAAGGDFDAFVTKLNQAGDGVFYTTYLGGNGGDLGYGITVDDAGNAYVTGSAEGNFPTTPGAYQSPGRAGSDVFLTKLNPAGSGLVFSALLGGNNYDEGLQIRIDPSTGEIYLAGTTASTNLPTTPGAFRTSNSGGYDGYAAKLNAAGTALQYLTYFGGSGLDLLGGMDKDSAGSVYLSGQTSSLDLPTQNALQGALAAQDRGFFRSSTGGASWSLGNAGLPVITVNTIAVAPTTPTTTIYLGADGRVFKSTDQGATWANTGAMANFSVRQLLIDPTAPNTIYAGTSSGVYKSTDAGATWVARSNGLVAAGALTPFPSEVRGLALHPSSPNTVYATTFFDGVFKTTDGGANWAHASTGLPAATTRGLTNAIVVDPSAPGTLYVVISSSTQRVYKTTNGGASWTPSGNGLAGTVNALAINPTAPATLYAATTVGMYRTTDGGANWNAINNGLLQPRTNNTTSGPSVTHVVVDPTSPLNVYAAAGAIANVNGNDYGLTTVFKSADGGNNWAAQTSGFNNSIFGIGALAVDPTNGAKVYAGTQGFSSDGFVTKLNPDGSGLVFSTFIGGSGTDFASNMAVDDFNSVYVTGGTMGFGFPTTAGAFQTTRKGARDSFVTKFGADGASLAYSTLLGGTDLEDAFAAGLAVDAAGNAYVTGSTQSADFPVTPGAFQTTIGNRGARNDDLYVAKLNAAGSALGYSSYLGGGGDEVPFGLSGSYLALDAFGNAYVMGDTLSTNFTTYDTANPGAGTSQTFVAKIAPDTPSYSIIGRLTTTAGAPIANQGVSAFTPQGDYRFTQTDAQGYYSLISLPAGDYVVTPSQFGGGGTYGFSPASRTFTGLNSNQTADFTGTQLYTISGRISDANSSKGVVGVAVTLSGAASATTTTGFGGTYQFPPMPAGNYAVTPSRPGYTFTPPNRTFINLSADQPNANFTTPSVRYYTVSGRVAHGNGVAISGVTVGLFPNQFETSGPGTTDANGNYSITGVQSDLSYYVIPIKSLLTFSPNIPQIANLTGPTTLDFTAAPALGLTGKLAYVRNDHMAGGSGTAIYTANADGTGEARLPNAPDFAYAPDWSPDGARLAFISDEGDPVNSKDDIYTISSDGTGLVRLTDSTAHPNVSVEASNPAWSPDGSMIAYEFGNVECTGDEGRPVPPGIFTIKPDGSGRAQLTNTAFNDSHASWSPDGTKLSFARTDTAECSTADLDIWAMNADGSGQTKLTNTDDTNYEPAWSPDGTKIAFTRDGNGNTPETSGDYLFVMNTDGTGLTNLTPFLPYAYSPTWSPDGTRIAFTCPTGMSPTQICSIKPDGTGFTQLTPGGAQFSYFDPAWRPDPSLRPAFIAGRVADTNGAPIAGAAVTLSGGPGGATTTDANGFYSFANVPRGVNYAVTPALAGRVFSPAAHNFPNLSGTALGNFSSTALSVSVSGRVVDVDNPNAGLAGVTVTLSGSATGSTTTDAQGNYTLGGLALGGNYTVTPSRANYEFESPAQTFTGMAVNRRADFVATLVYAISGRATDGETGAGLAGVTVTVSGTRTVVTTTDASGGYSVTVPAGGNYTATAVSPYHVLTPARADFPNLSAPQTANFASVPAAAPTPTPQLSDNFNGPQRDVEKWSLGAVSVNPESVDPLVPVVQTGGRLQITPRPDVAGERFNGYVSVRPVDLTGGRAGVEVVQATTSTAQTIFGIGSDQQNNYRFVVTTVGSAPPGVVAALRARGGWEKLTANTLVLVFQVKINGVVTQEVIPYSPAEHRFWRFRHDAPVNAVVFETSPDNARYNEKYRKNLEKSVSAVAVELTAGTAAPTTGGGTAVYDNFNLTTSAVQFKVSSARAAEGARTATVSVERMGSLAGAASVEYATADDPAAVPCDPSLRRGDGSPYPSGDSYARCDYSTVVGTLSFAAGEAEKTFSVPLIDDAFVEGDEAFRVILRNPAGAGLSAGAMILTLGDDDTSPGGPNPIRATPFFVRLHYLDFLGREPEAGEPWTGVLNRCPPGDAGCDRTTVSAAFFGSPEFQLKGLYVFRFYRLAFNRLPQYDEIIPDMSFVAGATPEEVYRRRAELATLFTRRPEFQNAYGALANGAYVAALMGRYQLQQVTAPDPANPDTGGKVVLTAADLTNRLDGAGGALTRAQVFRAVADSDEVSAREFNNAFVAMQYYGYLRRTPEPGGYDAWLRVINQDPSNIRQMVEGFMNSQEYALRFGKP